MGSTAPAISKPGLGASLEDVFNYQRSLVDTMNYEFLGRVKRIVLEAEEGARTQAAGVTSKIGHILEWYNQPHPKGGTIQNYLPIGQSRDRKMLLALEYVMRRDDNGRLTPEVGLPDMPDPAWNPKKPASTQEAEAWAADPKHTVAPPMIRQDLNQLTDKIVHGSELLVFQTVAQILFQPVINESLQATYWTIVCEFDPASRTHPAFLVDRRTGEAHFYGGKYRIEMVG